MFSMIGDRKKVPFYRLRLLTSDNAKPGIRVVCREDIDSDEYKGLEEFSGTIIYVSRDKIVIKRDDGKRGGSENGNWICCKGLKTPYYFSNAWDGEFVRIHSDNGRNVYWR